MLELLTVRDGLFVDVGKIFVELSVFRLLSGQKRKCRERLWTLRSKVINITLIFRSMNNLSKTKVLNRGCMEDLKVKYYNINNIYYKLSLDSLRVREPH